MKPTIKLSGIDKTLTFGDVISRNISQEIQKETDGGLEKSSDVSVL